MKRKILVVDDEKDICDVLANEFEDYGFEVITKDNCVEALELVKQGLHPDIIISDIKMPEIDGIDFLNYITDNNIIVEHFFFFSGVSALTKSEAKAMGANGLFYKPFELDELIKTVTCDAF